MLNSSCKLKDGGIAKKTSKMYKEVGICHATKYANKVGMMHESKGQHIGKAPSLHLFHTTVRQCMAQSQDSENDVNLRLRKFSDYTKHKHCNCKGKESWVSFLT